MSADNSSLTTGYVAPANSHHPHPRASWKYLETKEEWTWAGSYYIRREWASYFLCLECGAVLRVVGEQQP